jgi:hypothetical protein
VGIAQQRALTSEPPPTANAIMARVAANQDRAEEERTHYVYMQHTRVISRRGKIIMCEEITDSRVTPSANGSHIELLKLDGRLLQKHHYVTYTTLLDKENNIEADRKKDRDELHGEDVDRDLVENMRKNLVSDKSRDGIGSKLFPLTSKNQREYMFHLVGREHKNGREVFHIVFEPKNKNEYTWKGDAFVDTAAYQPVVVNTAMARKIPLVARTLLGTNVPGLGFTIVYAPQPDGVWFPISAGTEFKVRIFFLFSRQIVIDAQNLNFEKTHVNSRIVASQDTVEPR